MHSSFQSVLPSRAAESRGRKDPRRRGELLYQAMTIAAMLIVLVSVWVF